MKQIIFKPDASAAALVVGDIILDRYIHGETSRISPEAPVPVVRVKQTEERPGGAGNVAQNLRAAGVQVNLIGITGDDASADTLMQQLTATGVNCEFSRQAGFPTVTKLRVVSQHQQLLRLDYEEEAHIADTTSLIRIYEKQLGQSAIVVLSDYAKGSLGNIQAFIKIAREAGIPVLIDPKGKDFSRYHGATLITPNQKELEAVVGAYRNNDELMQKASELRNELLLDALLITRGENGMTLVQQDQEPVHLKAEAHEVYDVTGAGDTVIAVLAAALISAYTLEEATAISNIAAGIVVEKLGTATVTADEINHARGNNCKEIASLDLFIEYLHSIKRDNKKIIMTNGCFDVLHAGHASYLKKAKQLGDYLIIAVNDDSSVKQLKGDGRPVVPLEQRLAVLAALESVDWVIPFSEETPENLIKHISPDVLVKGGDYKESDIAGAEHVKKSGGKVVIFPLEAGCSTTDIIEKITHLG